MYDFMRTEYGTTRFVCCALCTDHSRPDIPLKKSLGNIAWPPQHIILTFPEDEWAIHPISCGTIEFAAWDHPGRPRGCSVI